MRRTHTVVVVWGMFAAVVVAIVVTYSRHAPEDLYNVTGRGFVDGGLSRALVYVNFPIGIAAMAMLVVALPWVAAELGLDFTHVPVLGQIFQTHELRYQPGPYFLHPAVHYGDHHGLEGTLLVITGLLLSRLLGAVRSTRLHAASGFFCALLIAYGLGNIANDFWLEQVVKRGWTRHFLPDVLEPKVNWGWLAILVGALALWLIAFRPRTAATVSGGAGRVPTL